MSEKNPTVQDIVRAYNLLVRHIDEDASVVDGRAYGGMIRSGKGLLVEGIAKSIIEIARRNIGGTSKQLSFEKKLISVPIRRLYIDRIDDAEIRDYIRSNVSKYVYKFRTDVHVSIDQKFVMGVECKAYTENAMFKRVMVDFTFLKQTHPEAHAILLQLESQLGGDYGDVGKEKQYGSFPTRTILSYFDVDLTIVTLLEGERKVDRPIHKEKFFKPLEISSVKKAVKIFEDVLKRRI